MSVGGGELGKTKMSGIRLAMLGPLTAAWIGPGYAVVDDEGRPGEIQGKAMLGTSKLMRAAGELLRKNDDDKAVTSEK